MNDLEEAMNRVTQPYFGEEKLYEPDHVAIHKLWEAATAHLRLLKAIDEKRMAVVPCEAGDDSGPSFVFIQVCTLSAVDQQSILKELQDVE